MFEIGSRTYLILFNEFLNSLIFFMKVSLFNHSKTCEVLNECEFMPHWHFYYFKYEFQMYIFIKLIL